MTSNMEWNVWKEEVMVYCNCSYQALLIFERKIFRRMYGPKYENGEWKSRRNRKLEEMSKGENIVKWIKRANDKLVRSPTEKNGGG